MTNFHPATIFETLADRLGDKPAVIHGDRVTTWAEFDQRAGALAGWLAKGGFGADSKLGLYLYNSSEYLEGCFAAYKLRGVPININYRYVADELAYLLDNRDSSALLCHSSLADRVGAVLPGSRVERTAVVADDDAPGPVGTVRHAEVLRHASPARIDRAETDLHMVYTGGTTGMPKGVMYHLGGLTRELLALGSPVIGATPPESFDDIIANAEKSWADDAPLTTLVLPPLMHGTGFALAFITLLCGGTTVMLEGTGFDPDAAITAIGKHQVQVLNLVGDAFGRPLAAALDAAAATGAPADLSSVKVIMSSGAMLSAEVRDALLAHAPGAMVIDTLAASEAAIGTAISMAGMNTDTAVFSPRPGVVVLDEDDQLVEAGSERSGRVAVESDNPIGYYKDPEKTAATFRVVDGVRYSFPGDWATVAADGSLHLLGRGSNCINTGGEKVYPEEVEEALKRHDAVVDALVFGVADPKWGQRIEAVVSTTADVTADTLVEFVRASLAAYKSPKEIHFVAEVPRAPNGKADYATAKSLAGHAG